MGNVCDPEGFEGDASDGEGHAPRRYDESERLLSRAPASSTPIQTLTYIVREYGGTLRASMVAVGAAILPCVCGLLW